MLNSLEAEKRKREFFFEVCEFDVPEVASPEEVIGAEESVEDIFGVIGAVIGAAVGALTGGVGFALVGAIAQGIATGFAIGSMIDALFAPEPETPDDPQRLPDPTYTINSAGSEALAERGGVIPLIYTNKKTNPKGGVRYLGKLIYSSMNNENNRGILRQLYVLGYRGLKGNEDKSLFETLLFNNREADEIFFEKLDDEVNLRFISSNEPNSPNFEKLSSPFIGEYSQAVNPNQFQKFGYRLVSEVDLPDGEEPTRELIRLPDDDDEDEINQNNVFAFSRVFSYQLLNSKIQQFVIKEINTTDFYVVANRPIKHTDQDKLLETRKFKYSTTKSVNYVFFNIDYVIFGKDLRPSGED